MPKKKEQIKHVIEVEEKTGEQCYIELKRRKVRLMMISWCVFTVAVVLFFSSTPIISAIFGSDAYVTSLMPFNIFAGDYVADAGTAPFYVLILRALYALIIAWMALKVVWVIMAFLKAKANNRQKTILDLISSCIKYGGALATVFVLLGILGVPVAALLAGAGVIGIVIAFGTQQLLADILAGLFIVFEDNFGVGDIITYGTSFDLRGEVEQIGIRTTRIKAMNGDVHIINNSELRIMTNLSKYRSVVVCEINIDYTEDLEKVEKLINDNLKAIAKKFSAITEGPEYKGPQEFNPSGVKLRIVAKCNEFDKMQLTRDLNREFKLLFDKNKIKIAVPKVVIKQG